MFGNMKETHTAIRGIEQCQVSIRTSQCRPKASGLPIQVFGIPLEQTVASSSASGQFRSAGRTGIHLPALFLCRGNTLERPSTVLHACTVAHPTSARFLCQLAQFTVPKPPICPQGRMTRDNARALPYLTMCRLSVSSFCLTHPRVPADGTHGFLT